MKTDSICIHNISDGIVSQLIPQNLELVSGVTEVYELELAYLESKLLSEEEIIRNGAYFARVNDKLTRHYLMCKGEPIKLPQHSSSRLKSFFQTNQYKTGYSTHGLFPYRGKFHPQMIKALMNIMGLKPGDTVLDPMMGSGTVLLEARLMGIRSIGFDVSPFCCFMTRVKLKSLTMPREPIKNALKYYQHIFSFFQMNNITPNVFDNNVCGSLSLIEKLFKTIDIIDMPNVNDSLAIFNFFLLAYLDSVGYSERSDRKSPLEQFKAVLERYYFVVEKIQRSIINMEKELADTRALVGDARLLTLAENSIDGIIFSPPYSFAIDYLENDSFHLNYFNVDTKILRENMIGLRGKTLPEKFELYLKDMESVLSGCSRVLKSGKYCIIIIGTNDNQLSKILNKPIDSIQSLDTVMVNYGNKYGLRLIRTIERQITGIANTMRYESIIILQKS